MDFSGRQQESGKRVTGLGVVIILHVFIGWAFVSGLATDVVKMIQKPMEAVVKPPEITPPPPDATPPPPKLVQPPPPFIPPPEIQVQQQAPSPNAISAVSNVKPETNTMTKAVAPVEAPKPVAAPVVVAALIDFQQSGCKPEYPRASLRNEETGETGLSVSVGADGTVTDVTIVKSSGFRGLDNAVRAQLMSGSCRNKPGTVDGKPQATTARVNYVWRLD